MSEKYTVENSYASYSHSYCVKKDNEVFEYFRNKEKSELVCRLLNEDEKRKSAPRIDKNIKRVILEGLENKKDNYEIEIINGAKEEYIHKKFKQYENAIEIIKNLAEGE